MITLKFNADKTVVTGYTINENAPISGHVEIPSGVTSIGIEAFSWCSALTSITIPDNATSIGALAFSYCSALTSISLPNSVTSIGYSAFFYCTGLTSITIPNSVTSIGARAFSNCTALTNITIPDSVTSIKEAVFSNCTALTNITIPDSVTSIEAAAFSNCTALTSITIPNGVTSIKAWVFYNCTALTRITIPNSVTSIEEGAFHTCRALTNIDFPGSVTSFKQDIFMECAKLVVITTHNNEVLKLLKANFSNITRVTYNNHLIIYNNSPPHQLCCYGSEVKKTETQVKTLLFYRDPGGRYLTANITLADNNRISLSNLTHEHKGIARVLLLTEIRMKMRMRMRTRASLPQLPVEVWNLFLLFIFSPVKIDVSLNTTEMNNNPDKPATLDCRMKHVSALYLFTNTPKTPTASHGEPDTIANNPH